MIHITVSMKNVFHICLGVLLLQNPCTARLYRRDAYVARRYGDGMVSTGSWDSHQGIESYGWNNRGNPIDEACNICNSFSSSQGMPGYGSPQYLGGGSHHYRENHEKSPYNMRPGDQNYRGNGYDNLSPEWNQRYRPRDRHKPTSWSNEDEPGWTKLTSVDSGGGWSRPNTGIGVLDRKDTYRPGMYPVKVSTNDKGYWDSHPPREIPWEGDRDQSNDTKYSGSKNQGYGSGRPYQPGSGGYTDDFRPWDQTTKGVSGWDGSGKGIYVASSTPGGPSYSSGYGGDSQKTSTRRPNYSVTIQEYPDRDQSGYNRPGPSAKPSNSYIPPSYPHRPASGHVPTGPDQWDRPTSSRPPPLTGYGSTTTQSFESSSWDRPTTARPSSSYDRPSNSWSKPSGSSSWDRPTSTTGSYDRPSSTTGSYDRPTSTTGSYDRPSNSWSKPSSSYDRPSSSLDKPSSSSSYDKPSSSWSKPTDSWDRPVAPNRENTGYGSSGPSIDNAPLGPDNSYIPPGPAYPGITTLHPPPSYHHRFPSSNANSRPGYDTPVPTGTGYDMKRPCNRGGCSSGYDRPMMMSFGGYGRPSGNRYGNSESNYGQSGSGSYDGYGVSSGGHRGSDSGHRGGGGYNNDNSRENWGSGGYNSNRGGSSYSGSGNSWGSGGYNSNRGGGYNSDSNNSWNSGGSNSNRGSSGWMNLNSNRGSSSYGPTSGYRGSSYGHGGSGNRGVYGDNSPGYGSSGHRHSSDGYGSSTDNYGSGGHGNRGSGYGGNRNNQGGGYGSLGGYGNSGGYGSSGGHGNFGGYGNSGGYGSSGGHGNSGGYGNSGSYGSMGGYGSSGGHGNSGGYGGSGYDSDGGSGYGSNSDSDRYNNRPSYGSSRPGGFMSGGYDYSRPSYGPSSSMRPYDFDRVGQENDYSSSSYRPDEYPSSTTSPTDGYSTSTHGPNYDGYGSTPDTPFQPYDQSSTRPFLDYDRGGSPYPSDRFDYLDGPPPYHKHTGLYKVPFYNGHSGVGASTEFGFPTNIANNPGNDHETTTTTTTTTSEPDSNTTTTESPVTGNSGN